MSWSLWLPTSRKVWKDIAMNAKRADVIALTTLLLSPTAAAAQIPPPTVTAPVPQPNPSSSLVVPGARRSSRIPGAHCLDQRRHPVFGTIARSAAFSTAGHASPDTSRQSARTCGSQSSRPMTTTRLAKSDGDADTTAQDHTLDTISQMYATLRACWVPPPKIRRVTHAIYASASP